MAEHRAASTTPDESVAEISPLIGAEHDRAREIFNHWVESSTASFHEASLTPEEFAAEILHLPDPRHGAFGVRVDGALAGYVTVAPFKGRCAYRDSAEVSVYLAPDQCGRGLGAQALEYAVAHARTQGLHVLIAVICAENTASLAAFERAGFVEVGRLREVGRKFGRLLDVAYLQLTLG